MSTEVKIKPIQIIEANPGHAKGIYDVQRNAWLETYPNDEFGITSEQITERFSNKQKRIDKWEEILSISKNNIWVAMDRANVIGFCGIQKFGNYNRLSSVYVDPKEQDKGVGSMLIKVALHSLGTEKDIILDVASYNKMAISFYKKHGFTIQGKTPECDLLTLGNTTLPETRMVLKTS